MKKSGRRRSLRSSRTFAVMLPTTWPRMSSPTRSIVRNVADFGHPTACPVSASTSSIAKSISCISRITFSTENVPMRLPMKFGVSFAITTPLPSCTSQKCATASIAARSASGVGISLQQPHIPRRIEKVRAKPRPPEVVAKILPQSFPPASRWCSS